MPYDPYGADERRDSRYMDDDEYRRMREAGLPAALSYSAGAFVCNDVLYTLLHRFHGTETRVGFIHVPYLPEQAKEGQASMPLERMIQALELAIGAI